MSTTNIAKRKSIPRAEATPAEPVSRVDPATGMTPKVAAMLERERGGRPLPSAAEAAAERLANIDRAEAAAVRVFAAGTVALAMEERH